MRQCFCLFFLFSFCFCPIVFSLFSFYFLVLFHRGMHARKVLEINIQNIKDQRWRSVFNRAEWLDIINYSQPVKRQIKEVCALKCAE